jgi:hypothetical protein
MWLRFGRAKNGVRASHIRDPRQADGGEALRGLPAVLGWDGQWRRPPVTVKAPVRSALDESPAKTSISPGSTTNLPALS